MPYEKDKPDPDDTALDMELIEEDDGIGFDDPADDLDQLDASEESYVWDAAPEDESPSAGTRSGTSMGTRGGSSMGTRDGSSMGSAAPQPAGPSTGRVDREAAEELGLGWMDDEELEGLNTTVSGFTAAQLKQFKKQRSAEVKKQLTSVGGQFIIGLVVGCVTVAAIVLGATNWRNNAYLIPAAVITPFGIWYTFTRWKRWLGTAPYFYRLMTSLGEDAENLKHEHALKQLKKAQKEMKKHSNR